MQTDIHNFVMIDFIKLVLENGTTARDNKAMF